MDKSLVCESIFTYVLVLSLTEFAASVKLVGSMVIHSLPFNEKESIRLMGKYRFFMSRSTESTQFLTIKWGGLCPIFRTDGASI